MGIDDALGVAIAGRAYWTRDELGALYAPPDVRASVRVQAMSVAPGSRDRYAVSVIGARGAEQFTTMPTAQLAVAWSERRNLT